jgi:solute carrier family 66 (lysosomal lysine-arginine transporter), member 1
MVFLSMWALFSVGNLASKRMEKRTAAVGHVLTGNDVDLGDFPAKAFTEETASTSLREINVGSNKDLSFDDLQFAGDVPPSEPPEDDGPSTEYIIGRISAWVCTTLYLTSRLPQIWKNVRPIFDTM